MRNLPGDRQRLPVRERPRDGTHARSGVHSEGHEHSDEERPAYAAFIRERYGPLAHQLGWEPLPGEAEDRALLRPGLLALVAGVGEDPALAAEANEFLRWLRNDNFTFLGMRELTLDQFVQWRILGLRQRKGAELIACPSCGHHVGGGCPHCNKPVQPGWKFCPYCAKSTDPATAKKGSAKRLRGQRELPELPAARNVAEFKK